MTQLSRSALSSSFNTNLPDNNTGLITPAVLRTELVKTIDSVVFNTGETQTITGSQNISGSLVVVGNTIFTGSVTVSGSNTFVNVGPFNQQGFATFEGSGYNAMEISGSIRATDFSPTGFGGARFGHQIEGHVTHSGNISGSRISGSLEVSAITGSFTYLQGNSPITVGSEVIFLSGSSFQSSDLTITGSLTVSGSNTFVNVGQFQQTGIAYIIGSSYNAMEVSGSIRATDFSPTGFGGARFGHNIDGHITSSITSRISGSLEVSAITGSFTCLQGNSPITIIDQTEFLEPVTASIISASGEITSAGFNTHISLGIGSTDSPLFTANGRKVQVRNQLQSSLADGAFARFTFDNSSITNESIVLGGFIGNTTGPITGSIITVFPLGATTSSVVHFYNETGQTIPDDTPFTASFIVL